MTTKPDLDVVRAEIDSVDDAIHDLVMRRAALVERVVAAKGIAGGGRSAFRPGREAAILRRLAARHEGPMPAGPVLRIWRELISASVRMQMPFGVAVFAEREDGDRMRDAARDHFGASTPVVRAPSPIAALRAVSEGTATVAVLPWPAEQDPDPWWRVLMTDDAEALRVFARLPFDRTSGRGDEPDCAAVGREASEPTGDDLGLVALDFDQDVSRGRLRDLLAGADLEPLEIRSRQATPNEARNQHLAVVPGPVSADDPRLVRLREAADARVFAIGGYARPIGPGRP
jgi:chorismate mutase/prephenate dehydratase